MFDHGNPQTWLCGEQRKGKLIGPIIAPSILASDFGRLAEECADVLSKEGGHSEWLHLDIMDGHFVPNISFGPPVVQALRQHLPHAFFDVHLMVSDPAMWIPEFAKAGASGVTFHIEAVQDPTEVIALARKCNCQAGIAVKPKTPVSSVFPLCDQGLVDMILIMTVEPGFGGQKFMPETMGKVKELREKYPLLAIEVDGGLGGDTIGTAATAGANVIVAGTSIFKADSRKDVTEQMRQTVQNAIDQRMLSSSLENVTKDIFSAKGN